MFIRVIYSTALHSVTSYRALGPWERPQVTTHAQGVPVCSESVSYGLQGLAGTRLKERSTSGHPAFRESKLEMKDALLRIHLLTAGSWAALDSWQDTGAIKDTALHTEPPASPCPALGLPGRECHVSAPKQAKCATGRSFW